MRTARPSGKAVLVAGSLALTLVVGATSGAVAGGLITSKDIKDDTIRSRDIRTDGVKNTDIAPGAVNWDKSLDQATKDLIEGLVDSGAGTPGPQGPPGPAGPAGSGGGTLSAWSLYDTDAGDSASFSIANPLDDPDDTEDDSIEVELTGLESAGGATHLVAGSYLVTLRSLSPTLGVWVPQISSDGDLDGPTPSMGVCLSLFLPCETTFPVVVPASGADLQLFLGDIGGLCGCETADPLASLSVVSLASGAGVAAPAETPELADVVDGLVAEITNLIEGLSGPPAKSLPKAMKRLQRQYVG